MEECARMKALKDNLKGWRMKNGQLARQYSRCRYIREKDCNSKFVHGISSFRMKRKIITRLKVGNSLVSGKRKVMSAIRSHFHTLFQQATLPEITLPLGSFRMIDQSKPGMLKEIPSNEEII